MGALVKKNNLGFGDRSWCGDRRPSCGWETYLSPAVHPTAHPATTAFSFLKTVSSKSLNVSN